MQRGLWEKSYARDNGTGGYRRKALDFVSRDSIEENNVLTCRRNILDAMAQLATMWKLNW
jgi:hypothetical protein